MADPFWGLLKKSLTDSEIIEEAIARIAALYSTMLAFGTWAMVPKSQVDNETIEEAIARLILAHNNDEAAHLDTGQSLQSHKASEIIDHEALSIIADKFQDSLFNSKMVLGQFQSQDGYNIDSYITQTSLQGIAVIAYNPAKNLAYIAAKAFGIFGVALAGHPVWQARILHLSPQGGYNLVLGMGQLEPYGDEFFIGFRIEDNVIFSKITNIDYEQNIEVNLGSISQSTYHNYKIVVNATNRVEFYIDGVLKDTSVDPIIDTYYWLRFFYLYGTAKVNPGQLSIGVYPFTVSQD